MEPSKDRVVFFEPQNLRIYADGRIDRLSGEEIVPPSPHAEAGVRSKDVVVSPDTGLSARIFLPQIPEPTRKLALLVFFHGGAFCLQSPFSPRYHRHLKAIAADSNVVALSVHYRRAPEHLLPTAYDDAWEALCWAAAHCDGDGPEAWLNDHADFSRVFVAGVSAGGTIAHYTVRRAGVDALRGLRIVGLTTVHPFFDNGAVPDKLMEIIFPTRIKSGDPKLNPSKDPEVGRLGCGKVLIFVAERDMFRKRGWAYYEALKESEWNGEVEIVETEGEGHVFHLADPTGEKALALMKKFVSFLKET